MTYSGNSIVPLPPEHGNYQNEIRDYAAAAGKRVSALPENKSRVDRRNHRKRTLPPIPDCHCQHCDRKRIHNSTFDLLGNRAVMVYGDNIKLFRIHPAEACAGRPCVLHNPTDHHMRSWRLHWRADRKIFERICSHGIGHPDPDQFDYWKSTDQLWEQGIHGCDLCCKPPETVDVECAVCHDTYQVRADSPGWSSVWTCCIKCQAEEGGWGCGEASCKACY